MARWLCAFYLFTLETSVDSNSAAVTSVVNQNSNKMFLFSPLFEHCEIVHCCHVYLAVSAMSYYHLEIT